MMWTCDRIRSGKGVIPFFFNLLVEENLEVKIVYLMQKRFPFLPLRFGEFDLCGAICCCAQQRDAIALFGN